MLRRVGVCSLDLYYGSVLQMMHGTITTRQAAHPEAEGERDGVAPRDSARVLVRVVGQARRRRGTHVDASDESGVWLREKPLSRRNRRHQAWGYRNSS